MSVGRSDICQWRSILSNTVYRLRRVKPITSWVVELSFELSVILLAVTLALQSR